jgi:cytochrome c5
MLGTVVLLGLSLPFVLQERTLAAGAPGGDVTSPDSLTRVGLMLPTAGMPADVKAEALATADSVLAGRDVLLDKCVRCHDLKTILAKPRAPAGWWDTVERMAEKPALFSPMTEQDLYHVTAYLIAITPDLQKSTRKKRDEQVAREAEIKKAEPMTVAPAAALPASAKATYEKTCSQCHDLKDVDGAPPKTAADSRALVERMIKDNDAKIPAPDIAVVTAYLTAHYVDKTTL